MNDTTCPSGGHCHFIHIQIRVPFFSVGRKANQRHESINHAELLCLDDACDDSDPDDDDNVYAISREHQRATDDDDANARGVRPGQTGERVEEEDGNGYRARV